MIFTPTQFHFIASFISGILLVIVGIAVLSRDKTSAINKSFFGFFILLGLYELLTAFQVIFLNGTRIFFTGGSGPFIMSGTFLADLSRDLLTIFFILALACGAVGTLMINYGVDNILNIRTGFLGGLVVFLLIVLSVSHEFTYAPTASMMHQMQMMMGGMMSNAVQRDIFGWIGFYLSIILFTSIIIFELAIRIIQDKDNPVRSKMIRLLVGSVLVIVVLAFFDYIQVSGNFMSVMLNLGTHALLHITTFAGELLILSAFWTPIKVKLPSVSSEKQPTPA